MAEILPTLTICVSLTSGFILCNISSATSEEQLFGAAAMVLIKAANKAAAKTPLVNWNEFVYEHG